MGFSNQPAGISGVPAQFANVQNRAMNKTIPSSQAIVFSESKESPTQPKGRRRQEDRSRDTRESLMKAAIDVLLRVGYNRLTMKEVVKVAGVSSGALMHHFTNKEELVVAATAMVYDEAIVRGQRVAQTVDAERRPIEGYISDCMSVYFDWPFLAALETIMVARTDPALMKKILPVMENYRTTCDLIWLGVFKKLGLSQGRAEMLINLTLNLVRGMAVNNLWRHDEKHYKKYIKEWVAMAGREFGVASKT
jgi:AcrR family transcriptional regulator